MATATNNETGTTHGVRPDETVYDRWYPYRTYCGQQYNSNGVDQPDKPVDCWRCRLAMEKGSI